MISSVLLGSVIKKKRLERGWSQTNLGKRCDLSCVAICTYESGKRFPSFEILGLLATAFGMTQEALILLGSTDK